MDAPYLATKSALSRRHFLRGAGKVAIGLPFLEAMSPAFSRAKVLSSPPRFVAMCATLGFHTPHLFPSVSGSNYELTPYLEKLKNHRNELTVFSGLSHPGQQGNNGHASEMTWLTSARRPGLAGFRNTVSLDQMIATKVGNSTRFPYLALSTSGNSLSWTSNGVSIPGEKSPSKLFAALFIDGTEREVAEEMQQYRRGKSILDTVLGEATKLDRKLSPRDAEKLDEYLASVRELEIRMEGSEEWAQRPKPVINAIQPEDIEDRSDTIGRQRLMNDMIVLALQTDSTRTVTFALSGFNAVPTIPGVETDWHNLSHHGKDPEKIDELKLIEEAEFQVLSEFLTKLKAIEEHNQTLLDRTTVLYGSNLGNASSHNWRNLPIILAGGGFKHGSYTAHDPDNNTPLANLFVPLAQRMGVDIDQFGSSTAAGLPGLEA